MAPEQIAVDPSVDHRSDLYALGVVAYEILAGAHPFAGRRAVALLAAHATEKPEPITSRRQGLPSGLGGLVMSLLEKRPDDRPQSAESVLRKLDQIGTTFTTGAGIVPAATPPRPRWATVAGVIVALLLIGAIAYFLFGGPLAQKVHSSSLPPAARALVAFKE
jgi:serine/threonine-protein kinase